MKFTTYTCIAIITFMMLSGASYAGITDTETNVTEIVIASPYVEDIDYLQQIKRPGVKFLKLNRDEDALEQITSLLSHHTQLETVHLLTHGSEAQIDLGTTFLSSDDISDYSEEVAKWSSALSANADILIYGCAVAGNTAGQQLIMKLSQYTGADVAASDDVTGFEGDWELELKSGPVESQLFASKKNLDGYRHSLAIDLISAGSEWAKVLSNDIFDAGQDSRSVVAVDLVGSRTATHFYMKYDDGGTPLDSIDDEVAFRLRADNAVDNQARFSGHLWIGLDVDADSDIDIVMMAIGKNGVNSLGVYDSDNGINSSPSTTDIVNTDTQVTDGFVLNHSLIQSIDASANADVDGDSDPDYFVSFKVRFDALKAAIDLKTLTGQGTSIGSLNGGSGFTSDTVVRLVVGSAQNPNILISDIAGYDDQNDDTTITYAAKFALSGQLSFRNPEPVLIADGGQSTILVNPALIAADGAATTTVTVQLKDAIGSDLTRGGDTVVLNTTAGSLGPVTDNTNGSYSATLTSSTIAGTATISGTVNGATITDSASVVFFVSADITPPVISLLGNDPQSIEAGGTYSDAGATATDNLDGDISGSIVTFNPVNTAVAGTYTVTYNVSDSAGNAAAEVTRTVNVTADITPPVITLLGNDPQSIEAGGTYSDAGATATDNLDGDISGSIVTFNAVNTVVAGSYTVTYNVSDSAGNVATEVTRTVNVTADITPPVITLLGNDPQSIEAGGTYSDAGATASDNLDGDISGSIVTFNAVNTVVAGSYTVTYNVSDSAGNVATEVTRTVNVTADITPPVITLLGNDPQSIEAGGIYNDAGATATDNLDGDISGSIVTFNAVNTAVAGTYTVTYNVSDAAGNAAAEVTRVVTVTPDAALDSDGDGIPDSDEGAGDFDRDGVADYLDLDSDNDGITDLIEGNVDSDADGIADYLDLDSDNDGIFDVVESGADYSLLDTLGDGRIDASNNVGQNGLADIVETGPDSGALNYKGGSPQDSDSDGIEDYLDLDSDNDGLTDVLEAAGSDPDGDGIVGTGIPAVDANGVATAGAALSPVDTDGDGVNDQLDLDSDNDGIMDVAECGGNDADGDGQIDTAPPAVDAFGLYIGGSLPAIDSDSDGVTNRHDLDSDNDGIPDVIEAGGSDPDGDGIVGSGVPAVNLQGIVAGVILNPGDIDGDLNDDPYDTDSDGDGEFDLIQAGGVDVDDNGQVDGFIDTDGNGFDDGITATALPLINTDSDGDGIPDYKDNDDADNDGVPDNNDVDDDNDGIPDTLEGDRAVDTDGDGVADSLDLDSDNDGIYDLEESGAEAQVLDADNDGQIDGSRAFGTNGLADDVETDADSGSIAYNGGLLRDTDGDLTNDYRDLDSDGDGLNDVIENGGIDPDGDGYLGSGSAQVNSRGVISGSSSIMIDTDFDGTPDYRDNLDDRGTVLTGTKGIGVINFGFILLMFALLLGRKMAIKKRLLVVLLVVAAFESQARQPDLSVEPDGYSWYLGGALGYSIMRPDTDDSIYSLDNDTDLGTRIFAGLDLSNRISVELSLSDLGTATLKPVGEIDYQVLSFNFLYYAYQQGEEDHAGMSAYLKVWGLSKIDNDSTIPSRLENSSQVSLGFGVEYGWKNGFAIRGDLESFDKDAAILTVGLMYRFGHGE